MIKHHIDLIFDYHDRQISDSNIDSSECLKLKDIIDEMKIILKERKREYVIKNIKINLSENYLSSIEELCYFVMSLKKVVKLDLSQNRLTEDSFSYLVPLKDIKIDISGNNINLRRFLEFGFDDNVVFNVR